MKNVFITLILSLFLAMPLHAAGSGGNGGNGRRGLQWRIVLEEDRGVGAQGHGVHGGAVVRRRVRALMLAQLSDSPEPVGLVEIGAGAAVPSLIAAAGSDLPESSSVG